MDSEFGGFSWFTNMQHKFEALLPDVEDVLSDERLKYVEDQLQAVGSNIQTQFNSISTNFTQFCSEFAHEILSPSLSILNNAEKEVVHQNSDVILSKGNSIQQSLFFNKNEKILLTDQKEFDAALTENEDLVLAKIQNGKYSCSKCSFSDTVMANGRRRCKDCQDVEEATVSLSGDLSIQDNVLKSRSSNTDNILLGNEVTVLDNYFTSDCAEYPLNMDGEEAGNQIIIYDDQISTSSEMNLDESCVMLEKDEHIVVCHAKQRHHKEKPRVDDPNRNLLTTDSDWEII